MSRLTDKDLMVGDWLLYNGEPKQVMEILFDSVTIDCFPCSYDRIEPILLTKEILEKNGWDGRYGPDCFDEDKTYLLEIDIDKDGRAWRTVNGNEYNIFEIKWVHQLQHALKVVGIEKEIIL